MELESRPSFFPSFLSRPIDQLLISRRALSIHWHLHFDFFLLVARAAPLSSPHRRRRRAITCSRPCLLCLCPASVLGYSTNRMMEVAASAPAPACSAAAIASFAPLHLRPISFNPPSVTSFVTLISALSLSLSLSLSLYLHSWAVLSLLASVRPSLASFQEISHCSPLGPLCSHRFGIY